MNIICISVRSSVLANFRSYVFSRGGGGSDGSSSPAAWSLADAEFIRFVDGVLSGSDSRNKVKIHISEMNSTCRDTTQQNEAYD